ncbi:MAG: hypothetical protein JO364_14635 [Pseudonocardiales bacterium]|nr:hypothetical protein [Pseudonocardiales bacterium]
MVATPRDEPYLWDYLIHHLHGAGNDAEVVTTMTDPAYLATRSFLHGPRAAEADLRRTEALLAHPDLRWWRRWFGRYGHLISGLPTLSDTAATTALQLADTLPSTQARSLNLLQSPPYLTSLWGLSSASESLHRVLTGHHGPVFSVAFSPDGTLLASAGGDGAVWIWETASGRERTVLTGHQEIVSSVAFSPDGTLLASVGRDGTMRVWGDNAMVKVVKLGFEIRHLSWHGGLLALAVDQSVVVLRIAHTLA